MKKILILYIVAMLCMACSKNKSQNVEANSDMELGINDTMICDSALYINTYEKWTKNIDLNDMKKYQTFDEFELKGKGKADKSPFVYVKRLQDTILVVSTKKEDSIRLYMRIDKNLWYNRLEYDMQRRNEVLARVYDRYIYNDTLLEVKNFYGKDYVRSEYIVKCKNKLFEIANRNLNAKNNINAVMRQIYKITNHEVNNVNEYRLDSDELTYNYTSFRSGDAVSYTYKRDAYGLWGIQPGIDEKNTFLKPHEPEPEEKHTLHSNPQHIYNESEVDVSPSFPNGINAEMAFVNKSRKAPLLLEGRHKVIGVEIIVEKDGTISSAKVVKSIDKVHDEDALAIIKKMPIWQPATIGNTKVRCKALVPIQYRK